MLEQGHTCSSIKMDNTVFPSAPQAQQFDQMTAAQFSKMNELEDGLDLVSSRASLDVRLK
jgi:hypothetical protein